MMLPNRNTFKRIQQLQAVPEILEMLGNAFEASRKGHPLASSLYGTAMVRIEDEADSIHNMYDGGPSGTYWLCMPLTACGW